jgi:hypothetical protein
MRRLVWPLALVATFCLGWVAAGLVGSADPEARGTQATVSRLQQQVTALQARLQAREDLATSRAGAGTARPAPGALSPTALSIATSVPGDQAPGGARASRPAVATAPAATTAAAPATPATVQAALERFYKYLEMTGPGAGRERWAEARKLIEELRGMGDAAGQALMQVLTTGTDSDERRAAARLLGALQIPQALPLLRDVLEHDSDVLTRRAAAAGLRQMQTPESLPVMERLVNNPGEDRMVRLSAAYGLAEAGRPLGVSQLAHIFDESAADGRGRDMAFRALSSLNDDRAVPFMRQVAGSSVEPGYRLRAIRYLAAQGDREALPTLLAVMSSPGEQPSIRDAATSAYRVLGGR